ncbi:hypothetical protein AWENTII_012293 [Aspergillus wentii]
MTSGFDGSLYASQYPMAPSNRPSGDSQSSHDHHAQMRAPPYMPYPPQPSNNHGDVGHFAFHHPSHEPTMLSSSASGSVLPVSSHADELHLQVSAPMGAGDPQARMVSDVMSYDPLSGVGTSMPMGMDAGNAFAYQVSSAYPPSTTAGLEHNLHRRQHTSIQSQTLSLDHSTYSNLPAQPPFQDTYWPPHHTPHGFTIHSETANKPSSSEYTHSVPPQNQGGMQRQPQDPQSFPQSYASAPSQRSLQPRAIQPKRPSLVKGTSSSSNNTKSDISGESSPYANVYSNSGFDMMGALARVVSRPDPKINIGAVDLSCAFVLCDITREDHPIVYVSDAFERLTGYTEEEIVGRNCRFLQAPDGLIQQGSQRRFVDEQTAFRLRSTIEERTEIQASLINYRKGGQPFMNLITMIPIRWNSDDYRFYVGFQVDLVEKPDAVTKKNSNGTYMINYQRNQLPHYIVPSPEMYDSHSDLAPQFTHDDISHILNAIDENHMSDYRQYLNRLVVENTDDVIYVLSFEGEFLYLSPSCQKVLEYNAFELVGKMLSTVCHPSDIGPAIRDLRASTTTDPVSVVYRMRKKRSGYIWFESHGSWHIGERGRENLVMVGRERPVFCLDQLANIGGEELAENDLWVKLSMSGMILFVSSKSRPVLGRAPEDIIGKGIQEFMAVESRLEAKRALEIARSGQQTTFGQQMRHRKGHMLQVQTTLFPGDTKEGTKPTFLIAQMRFPKSLQPATGMAGNEESAPTDTAVALFTGETGSNGTRGMAATGPQPFDYSIMGANRLPSGNQYVPAVRNPTVFTELNPTRGSSWQVELRELEKQNRTLSDELQRLLTRKKKRKRKQSNAPVEKNCAMCQTKNTPEWRRGPSGNRDLCNGCGLRWAKQNRAAQPAEKSVPA